MGNLTSEDVTAHFELKDMIFSFVTPFVLKAVVSLDIPKMISEHGPLSVDQMISLLSPKYPQPKNLQRILRFLVHKKVFSEITDTDGEYRYGLTNISKWLVTDPYLLLMAMVPEGQASFQKIHESVLEDGHSFTRTNGAHLWEAGNNDAELNNLWNKAMVAWSNVTMSICLEEYDGFKDAKQLVDVAGGLGMCLEKIIQKYPHIKGVNLEVPHTVAISPTIDGVEHVAGDMFKSIPSGDTILIKSVLCNFEDEACDKILSNAYKALSAGGKLIVIDLLLTKEGDFEAVMDMVMLGFTHGGRERTQEELTEMLTKSGFSKISVKKLSSKEQLIEAYKV